ncbi:hypothetical protein IK112_02440 [Candidatus Saccharibacteria bacterium]|nr:hypothetical protein [Candidatus Saccharibacteria bacterium]
MKKFLICSMIIFSFLLISCGKEEKATTDTKEEKMVIINNIKPVEKEEPEVEETKGETTKEVVNVDESEPIEQETEDPVVEPAEEPTDPGEVDIEKFNKDGVYDLDTYAKALGYKQIEDPYHNGAFYILDKENTHIYFYKVRHAVSSGFNRGGAHLNYIIDDDMGENDPQVTVAFADKNEEESQLLLNDECKLMQIYATTPVSQIDFYNLPLTAARTLSYMNKEEEYNEDGFALDHCGDTDISKSFIKARGEQ